MKITSVLPPYTKDFTVEDNMIYTLMIIYVVHLANAH